MVKWGKVLCNRKRATLWRWWRWWASEALKENWHVLQRRHGIFKSQNQKTNDVCYSGSLGKQFTRCFWFNTKCIFLILLHWIYLWNKDIEMTVKLWWVLVIRHNSAFEQIYRVNSFWQLHQTFIAVLRRG